VGAPCVRRRIEQPQEITGGLMVVVVAGGYADDGAVLWRSDRSR
jgi:hypothetical protein